MDAVSVSHDTVKTGPVNISDQFRFPLDKPARTLQLLVALGPQRFESSFVDSRAATAVSKR